MIRLLVTTVIVFALYLVFSFISSYDASIYLQFMDYSIKISSFFFLSIAIIGLVLFTLLAKILAIILNAPSIISGKIKTSKQNHLIKQVIEGYALNATGDNSEAYKLISRIKSELSPDLVAHSHIILSASDPEAENRTHHLTYLFDQSEYSSFAAQELAKYFMHHKYYQQALDYLEKALEQRDHNVDLLTSALKIYSEMMMWDKFEEIVAKLSKLNPDSLRKSSNDIAGYYFAAAKDVLAIGEDDKAIHFLEQALSYKVDLREAATLLCELMINARDPQRSKKLLGDAFMASPSFELFELYIRVAAGSNEEIYEELCQLAEPQENVGLFISIATCLGIEKEARALVGNATSTSRVSL